ncbi:MAG: COG1615 family transporter [Chamaesiphon sp. CSU_1_12]|nr:COG1615 family transporter [Chamaesiphon sp. CSU_1_12]
MGQFIPSRAVKISSTTTLERLPATFKRHQTDLQPQLLPTALNLRWLLPLVLCSSLAIGAILTHYLRVALSQWQIDPTLPSIAPPAPSLLQLGAVWQFGKYLVDRSWLAVVSIMFTLALPIFPRLFLRAIAIALSLTIAWIVSRQWLRVLPLFQATAFGDRDPVFDRDISEYVFGLPGWEILEFALMGICLYGFIAVLLTYFTRWR